MKKFLSLLPLLLLFSCEKEISPSPNHAYTLSYLNTRDEWGIETWGSHHFVTDKPIQDFEAFKECYVNYLCWKGLDEGCSIKVIYYTDRKHVQIRYRFKSPSVKTVININNCQ
jgi:hypothetical protein